MVVVSKVQLSLLTLTSLQWARFSFTAKCFFLSVCQCEEVLKWVNGWKLLLNNLYLCPL